MGITESTLTPMDEEQRQTSENATSDTANMSRVNSPPHSRQLRPRRQRRATEPANTSAAAVAAEFVDDPWWWEIENENLILDQVPPHVSSENESENASNTGATTSDRVSHNSGDTVDYSESTSATMKRANDYGAALGRPSKIDEISERVVRDLAAVTHRAQTLEEFKEELRCKRQLRQTAVQDLRDEIGTLRKQLAEEKALTRRLRGINDNENEVSTAVDNSGEVDNSDEAKVAARKADNETVSTEPDADDTDPESRGRHANIELANAQLALQMANSENLSLRTELGVVQKQVGTLKEVIACCKQMLKVKEEQCDQLKSKLTEIETSFGERELRIMSTNLRQEYERQLGNIRQLRQLYDERQRIAVAEQENLQRLISIKKDELNTEQEKTKHFEERIQALVQEIEGVSNELAALRDECNEHKFEKRILKEEMGAVNTLFSQMVMGFHGKNNLDIDRLTTMLEENRTLLNDMATKEVNCSDGATLPKLLFELVEQATVNAGKSRSSTPVEFLTASEDEPDNENEDNEAENDCHAAALSFSNDATNVADTTTNNSTQNETSEVGATAIGYAADSRVEDNGAAATCNLTEVTTPTPTTKSTTSTRRQHRKSASNRIKLPTPTTTALLQFHEPEVIGKVASAQEIIGNLPKVWRVLMELLSHHKIEQVQFEENGAGEDCYKSVETPNGPKAELSVSKTYIKLKDLILEKKSLVKETNRLKTLNSHLEYRLNEQEKRLSAVSLELTKTWHLVGKMQRQHRQLHTQEQILRYQLQQKRRLLSELKDELEYCRRKWAAARAKNDESQEQCNDLRREFAQRKLDDANNSAESGYSDSGPASDEEERAAGLAAVEEVAATSVGVSACSRRKYLKEMFEHTRKIKRMQSTSPGRAGAEVSESEIVLRWNSAPPTCGWHTVDGIEDGRVYGVVQSVTSRGAIPKGTRISRSKHRSRHSSKEDEKAIQNPIDGDNEPTAERTTRIQRLEEQCKSLIQQVLETSDNRERLEVQLCRFQDEIAPVQYPVPLAEFVSSKRNDRMARASSAPVSGTLTPREEEYTRKRSERLERLEEESRQLMSRIKRTSDRGHYLRCSLDRLRRAPNSREGSFESNTEEEDSKKEEVLRKVEQNREEEEGTAASEAVSDSTASISEAFTAETVSPLTAEEEAYTARRAARLQRLEEESKQLMTRLSRTNARSNTFEQKLDTLHEKHDPEKIATVSAPSVESNLSAEVALSPTIEQRIDDIAKISSNREERLRILEEEGKELLSRLSNTSERGSRMIDRIARRELQRQARANSEVDSNDDIEATAANSSAAAAAENDVAAEVLIPCPKNIACSSIVSDELTDCITVTTTASQIATQQGGAVPKTPKMPKSQPTAQLNAAVRAEAAKRQTKSEDVTNGNGAGGESLEEMIKRLRDLPFPSEAKEEENVGEADKSTDDKK